MKTPGPLAHVKFTRAKGISQLRLAQSAAVKMGEVRKIIPKTA